MKISIITPAYNQAAFIEETLKSIWSQQGDFDLEHIVADGGSTDATRDILGRYDALYRSGDFPFACRSFTFTWWSRPDTGQSQAINRGFDRSSGSILAWLNSDDTYLAADSLQHVRDTFSRYDADIVVGNARPIAGDGTAAGHRWFINTLDNRQFQVSLRNLNKNNFLLQPACFFRRHVWEKNRIDENLHFLLDWDFWLRAYQCGFRFVKTDADYATCRIHAAAKTVQAGKTKYDEGLLLFKKHNTWCLNRVYYNIYRILMKIEAQPLWAGPAGRLIGYGKRFRNLLVNRLRLY